MRHPSVPFSRLAAGLVLALGVAGCSSSTVDPAVMPDFEGTYSLSGTYTGRPGNSVHGDLVLTNQSGDAATGEISVTLTDNGNVFFALNAADPNVAATSGPVQAELETDGSFTVRFEGSEVISGLDPSSCCMYTFTLRGTLSGNRISGTWSLLRDMPSSDSGTFDADR